MELESESQNEIVRLVVARQVGRTIFRRVLGLREKTFGND